MRTQPRPRRNVYDLYWRFASDRQRIFERRVAGHPGPWTTDPILCQYKFCNVFRAADRVSQYLIREVAYRPDAGTPEDRVFQIVAFRTFSRVATWTAACEYLGGAPSIRALASGDFTRALEHAREINGGLYTGAFILCATNAFGKREKHLNHVELFRKMFVQGALARRVLEAPTLADVFTFLRGYPLMGDFMAYQTAIDLNYSSLVNFSENDFTCPGPGAVRGMRKVFESFGDYAPSEVIQWMVERQTEEFSRRGISFRGLWGRPLHAIDCQGLFCEVDKYCRVAMPELASERKRIKARFAASTDGIRLFFPPKWTLNDLLPTHAVLGAGAAGHTARQAKLDLGSRPQPRAPR